MKKSLRLLAVAGITVIGFIPVTNPVRADWRYQHWEHPAKGLLFTGSVATYTTAATIPPNTYAQNDRESSQAICNNPPQSRSGQQTLTFKAADVRGYRVRVELRSSNQSRTKWVRACVPRGTTLYLKDESGKRYVPYTTEVTGWNFGDKLDSTKRLRACSEYSGVGELCTDPR